MADLDTSIVDHDIELSGQPIFNGRLQSCAIGPIQQVGTHAFGKQAFTAKLQSLLLDLGIHIDEDDKSPRLCKALCHPPSQTLISAGYYCILSSQVKRVVFHTASSCLPRDSTRH
ncbi:hypothetical protein DSECCO2_511930 [anaerobic digester metagenome]